MEGNLTYSVEQLQKIIGVGRTTVYQLLKSGRLPAKKLNGRTLVLKSDLEKFLQDLECYPSKQKEILAREGK